VQWTVGICPAILGLYYAQAVSRFDGESKSRPTATNANRWAALSDEVRRNSRMDCELKDITVHYELLGEGRPIIMLHGWSVDHRHMVSDMEPLFRQRDGWKRIYLDLPGHGRTPGKD